MNCIYVGFGNYGSEGMTAPFYVGPSSEDLIKAYAKTHYDSFVFQKWAVDGSGVIEEVKK